MAKIKCLLTTVFISFNQKRLLNIPLSPKPIIKIVMKWPLIHTYIHVKVVTNEKYELMGTFKTISVCENDKKTIMIPLHVFPVYPFGHIQWYSLSDDAMHSPLTHGSGLHTSMSKIDVVIIVNIVNKYSQYGQNLNSVELRINTLSMTRVIQ